MQENGAGITGNKELCNVYNYWYQLLTYWTVYNDCDIFYFTSTLRCNVFTNVVRFNPKLKRSGAGGSSVSIVSVYGLDDRAIEVRSPTEAKDFSYSLCIQTGSGPHTALCPVGTAGPFSGSKARPGHDADNSPHLVPRSWMSRSYTSSHPCVFLGVKWDSVTFALQRSVHILTAQFWSPSLFHSLSYQRYFNIYDNTATEKYSRWKIFFFYI
jgi:hypothetical protein